MAYLSVTAAVTERSDVRHESHHAGSFLLVSDGSQSVGLIVSDLATAERLLHAVGLLRDSLLPVPPEREAAIEAGWREAEAVMAGAAS